MVKKRKDQDLPQAVEEWGWRFHHLGIPTDEPKAGERYLPRFGFSVSGFDTSPFGIEWMRFEKESPVHELIKRIPHLAFEVDNLDHELASRSLTVLTPPNSPGEGTRVAMILHDGAPVELIEFDRNSKITIRELHTDEIPSLENFMYDAIFVPEGVEKPAREIIYLPELACYFRDFGREHDICLIADFRGEAVGAVWIRLFPETGKGYGHVDAKTPELSMSVKSPFRQRGIGTRLLSAMLERLQRTGYEQVSLSVDLANYAFRMYEKAGFLTVSSDGTSATMLKKLIPEKK